MSVVIVTSETHEELAQRITQQLTSQGIDVVKEAWLARVYILLIETKFNLWAQLSEALTSQKRIIPVLIEKGASLPAIIADVKPADLTDEENFEREMAKILRALNTFLG